MKLSNAVFPRRHVERTAERVSPGPEALVEIEVQGATEAEVLDATEAEGAAAVGFEDGIRSLGEQAWSAVPDGPEAGVGPALPPAGWDAPGVGLVSPRVAWDVPVVEWVWSRAEWVGPVAERDEFEARLDGLVALPVGWDVWAVWLVGPGG